jgi:hypothetical protein
MLFRFRRFLQSLRDHHVVEITERYRSVATDGKRDAVLVAAGGRSVKLFVVRHGRSVHGGSVRAAFIHCADPESLTLSWVSESDIEVVGEFEDMSYVGRTEVIDQEPGRVTFRI